MEKRSPEIETRTKKRPSPRLSTIFAAVLFAFCFQTYDLAADADRHAAKPPRILHIMSFHLPWEWNVEQLNGFKHGLNQPDAEFRIFQMDTKRNNSQEWIQSVGMQARQLIDTWQPDLIYTNDDPAQAYVARHYVNHSIPFVFSGVNAAPGEYGFAASANVTGVLEHEHFVATITLLRSLVPTIRKIAVIIDDEPTWPGVVARMQAQLPQLSGIELARIETVKTFSTFKSLMADLQEKVDAVAMLGIFTFKDEAGANVPFTEVLRWTAENSKLPDFSFWDSRIPFGTLCAVAVSGYAQGFEAGKIARGILFDGRSPSSYPMKPTIKGKPVISLARANRLGLRISTDILLTVQVIQNFQWDE
ncbi:MAG: hypothetical protein C4519_04360 [Desulfobacteraceae bacterium]|nr:MAG: hypothetical protein C4519_04360 [Desulfobacteraceae bacterium]